MLRAAVFYWREMFVQQPHGAFTEICLIGAVVIRRQVAGWCVRWRHIRIVV